MKKINNTLGSQLTGAFTVAEKEAAAKKAAKISARAPRTHKVAKEKLTKGTTKEVTPMKVVKGSKNADGSKVWDPTTVGGLSNILLEAGYSAKDTLVKVKSVFPNGDTSMACIYYYASHNPKVSLARKSIADAGQLKKVLAGLK